MEEHYSLTVEPSGRYADHFVPEEATRSDKRSKQLAKSIVKWLMEHDCENTLLCLGGDSTNVNKGWQGGVITQLEQMIRRRPVWIVCNLHTN